MDERRRLEDLARRAARTGRTQFTRFLEPSSQPEASSAAHAEGVTAVFFGGFEDAERKMAAFCAGEPDEPFPIEALKLTWNAKFSDASHRDLLGAVMALGLKRETIGDICLGVSPGSAYLFCAAEVAESIIGSLESAGRAHLKVARADKLEIAPPKGTEQRITVQAPRMDAVLAAGYRLSRAEAQRLIAAGLVKLNHIPELRGDVHLKAGDLISARGYGRLRVDAIQGETRKGRLAIRVFLYGK